MTMMGSKIGTKAFGQTTPKPESASTTNLTPQDLEKLGGENIGEVLNKVADPNWIDPAKKTRTTGNANLDKDAFFKLMLTQMKNQDPTNPLKSHEMAAQLASFSSLEAMQNINTTLTEIKAAQKPIEGYQALNLIGKAVAGDSAKLTRMKGETSHDFRFNLPSEAADVSIKVRDSEGNVVRTYAMKNVKAGENKITWNGEDEKGNAQAPGDFDFFVEAADGNGRKLAVKTDFDGVITGVNYTPEGPVLMVGNQTIRWRDVKRIIDPSLKRNDQNINDVTALDLKKDNAAGETKNVGNEAVKQSAPPAPSSNIMSSVGLSRDMMEKIAKETAKE
ncbi:MAG: flagellar hook assembly protein FlgD [Bdellovibrionia bacterium]